MPGRLDWNPEGAAYTARINFEVRALLSSMSVEDLDAISQSRGDNNCYSSGASRAVF